MDERFTVDGEAAVVTGGSRGIGRAIAETFAADGVDAVSVSFPRGATADDRRATLDALAPD